MRSALAFGRFVPLRMSIGPLGMLKTSEGESPDKPRARDSLSLTPDLAGASPSRLILELHRQQVVAAGEQRIEVIILGDQRGRAENLEVLSAVLAVGIGRVGVAASAGLIDVVVDLDGERAAHAR